MAFIVADNVRETSLTTGTGALALAGGIPGCLAFDDVCANNDTVPYFIRNDDVPTEWEVGLGTFTDTDTLTRTTVQASSNAGAAVNLSAGTKEVVLGVTAAIANRIGYLIQGATGLSAPADLGTVYVGGLFGTAASGTDGLVSILIPRSGTIKRAYFSVVVVGTLGTTENTAVSVRYTISGGASADTSLSAVVKHSAIRQDYSNEALAIAATKGDSVQFKLVYPTFATNPTNVVYIAGLWIE